MATTMEEIRTWLSRREPHHTHMIVVCDGFDYEDFPIWVDDSLKCQEVVDMIIRQPMQRIMEVYNLGEDLETQLNELRAYNI